MRCAAMRNAPTALSEAWRIACSIRSAGRRRPAAVRFSRSKRAVYSSKAASPRAFTSATMAPAAASTFSSAARLPATRRSKPSAKSGAAASSLSGTGVGLHRVAELADPFVDLDRPRLHRRAVDDQARGDVGDLLDLDEAVLLQRTPG